MSANYIRTVNMALTTHGATVQPNEQTIWATMTMNMMHKLMH